MPRHYANLCINNCSLDGLYLSHFPSCPPLKSLSKLNDRLNGDSILRGISRKEDITQDMWRGRNSRISQSTNTLDKGNLYLGGEWNALAILIGDSGRRGANAFSLFQIAILLLFILLLWHVFKYLRIAIWCVFRESIATEWCFFDSIRSEKSLWLLPPLRLLELPTHPAKLSGFLLGLLFLLLSRHVTDGRLASAFLTLLRLS